MKKEFKITFLFLLFGVMAVFLYTVINQHKKYLESLIVYTDIIRYEDTQKSCIIELKKFEKTTSDENALQAIKYAIDICAMSNSELTSLAQRYRKLGPLWSLYKKLAADIYYYSYHVYDDYESLYSLKTMGENVATTPLTPAEIKSLLEETKKNDMKVKEALQRNKESIKKSEKLLKRHSLDFSSSPEDN